MNILYLDESLPYPTDTGKRTRTYHLLRHLASHHQIFLIVFTWGHAPEQEAIQHLEEIGIRVVAVRRNPPRRSGILFFAKLVANLMSPLPFIVSDHFSHAYKKCVMETIAKKSPKLVVAEWTPYAVYFDNVSIPRVVVAHNIESRIWQGYMIHCRTATKRWYIQQQYRKVQAFENRVFRKINGLVTVSPIEQKLIQEQFKDLPVALVDNGVDVKYFKPAPGAEEPNLVTFVGSMDWRPNEDGMYYFADQILPHLRSEIPSVRVEIVGRNPSESLRRMGARLGITVTGRVDDVRPYLNRAAVVVVPLRIGGGSRLKILEAFSMAKAVVSTSLGAEGIRGTSGREIVIADDPQDFAANVARLLSDAGSRITMGRLSRDLVCKHYDWKILGDVQLKFLEKIADGSERAS